MSLELGGRIPVEGTALAWESTGDGPAVVLLHGFAFDRRMWRGQVGPLARAHRVVRYDLRGFGKSPPAEAAYAHADDLAALLAALRLERVTLLGMSLGGGAAINFTVQHPGMVRALIVVDPSLGGFPWSAEFTAAHKAIRAMAEAGDLEGAKRAWLALPMFAPAMANSAARATLEAQVEAYSGWHWQNADTGRPLTPPAIERLGEIRAPTLVVVGERDVADFHAIADTLARGIPGARKVELPGVGHMANLEDPARFNAEVLAFLGELDDAPTGGG